MENNLQKRIACGNCIDFGYTFYAKHIMPKDYIEGRKESQIWIIGLNPAKDFGVEEPRTHDQFENFDRKTHNYFKVFEKVLKPLYDNLGGENGKVAHTDLVKCFSKQFPKKIKAQPIIDKCKDYLFHQINLHKPKVVICNGTPVCREMLKGFPPLPQTDQGSLTSYQATSKETGHKFWVILSGFIGRIDDRNKRRLGREIEDILVKENIIL